MTITVTGTKQKQQKETNLNSPDERLHLVYHNNLFNDRNKITVCILNQLVKLLNSLKLDIIVLPMMCKSA